MANIPLPNDVKISVDPINKNITIDGRVLNKDQIEVLSHIILEMLYPHCEIHIPEKEVWVVLDDPPKEPYLKEVGKYFKFQKVIFKSPCVGQYKFFEWVDLCNHKHRELLECVDGKF